ncbi:MAG: T9SS type A sorting domain-containing protein [Ignavibacteriaceae bacterium]|nr:T9SS type A sorting domain-containing protein [Ignavibacteriaceae bacterium]
MKKTFGLFLFFSLLAVQLLNSQQHAFADFVRISSISSEVDLTGQGQILSLGNSSLIQFYSYRDTLYQTKSVDNGEHWGTGKPIITNPNSPYNIFNHSFNLSAVVTKTGRIILTYSRSLNISFDALKVITSDDLGDSWTQPKNLISSMTLDRPILKISPDGMISLVGKGSYLFSSTNNGDSWSSKTVSAGAGIQDLIFFDSTSYAIFYTKNSDLFCNKTSNNGITWATEINITNSQEVEVLPRTILDENGMLWLFYQKEKTTGDGTFTDIYYQQSSDKGLGWTPSTQFTNFVLNDLEPSLTLHTNNQIYVAFLSNRFSLMNSLWVGVAGISKDENAPHAFLEIKDSSGLTTLQVTAKLLTNSPVTSVTMIYSINLGVEQSRQMFDDGLHGDLLINDNTYGCKIENLTYYDKIEYHLSSVTEKNIVIYSLTNISNIPGPVNYGDKFKWLNIGSLQNWYGWRGSEVEVSGPTKGQQDGMQWPAQYENQDIQAWKSLWIGTKDFFDDLNVYYPSKVVHVGPRGFGEGEFFPQEFKLKSKFIEPIVMVNDVPSLRKNVSVIDEIDGAMIPDRTIENIVSTQIGLTVKRNVFQFSNQFNDNYIVSDYIFKNTGDTDANPSSTERKDSTLKDVYIFLSYRLGFIKETRYEIGNTTGWGMNTTFDTRGDGLKLEPPGEEFRTQFAWHGKYPPFVAYDNLGAPIWKKALNISEGDTIGRLGAPHFAGILTLHVDKSSTDKTDDINQPATTKVFEADGPLQSQNDSHNISKMNDEYIFMTSGHEVRHLDKIGETNPFMPTKDPASGARGGYCVGNGFGPFTINFGDSVHIVLVEAVNGISREKAIEVGKQYKVDRDALKKNTEFFKGKDSLFQTFKRAKYNFENNWMRATSPKPPATFSVKGSAGKIVMDWTLYNDNDTQITGFQIFRSVGRYDTTSSLIAELPGSARSYNDSLVSGGQNYFYYIVSLGNEIDANTELGIPGGRLISSRFYTQTYQPVLLDPSGIEPENGVVNKFSLAQNYPNPFNPATTIQYSLNESGKVELSVYNMLGQNVFRLVNEFQNSGSHVVKFDGSHLASGIYIYRIKANSFSASKKLILLK